MVFSTVFHLYLGSYCTYPCFSGVLLTSNLRNNYPSHRLLSYITIVKTMHSGDRGKNPVAMTIINPWGEYLWNGELNPVLKSCALPTELWG